MELEEKKDQELQIEYEELEKRVDAKAAALASAEAEVQRMAIALVDAEDKNRERIIGQRAKSATLRDALAAEQAELESRRDAAQLAIYEFREAMAREELKRVKEEVQKIRKENSDASREHRVFQNVGRAKMAKTENEQKADEMAVALDVKVAKLLAKGQIAQRELNRASHRWVVARDKTDEIRRELGMP